MLELKEEQNTDGGIGYPSVEKPWLKYYTKEQIQAPVPNVSLFEYLMEKNKDYPNDIALEYFGNKITYGRLFEMIDGASRAFYALGVRPGDIISIVTVSTVTSIVCFYALNRLGAVSNYVNVLSEETELADYFKEAKSKIVVSLDLFGNKVIRASQKSGVEKVIFFSVGDEMPFLTHVGYKLKTRSMNKDWMQSPLSLLWADFIELASKQNELENRKDPYKMALLCHTGGTTGTPKAVMLSDVAMNSVADYYRQCFKYERGQVWGNIMIPFVVYGILVCMHMPLCLGLTVSIIPKFDAKDWKKYLKKSHINYILGVPAYVNPMIDNDTLKSFDMSQLLLCGVGGDGMNAEMEQKINAFFAEHGANIEILKGYGMSEVCGTAITGLNGVNKIGSVGIPLIHNNVMIYDNESCTELTYGKTGEICLQCASQMMGYMDNEEETRNLIRKHDDGQEWLHTGDLGYLDEDGFLFLQGRMKRVILTTGDGVAYKVFPQTVENVLNEIPEVLQSCVVGASKGDDQVLRAFVVIEQTSDDKKQIERELRSVSENKLPAHARPTFYTFVDELPLTSAGKIDYRSLENYE